MTSGWNVAHIERSTPSYAVRISLPFLASIVAGVGAGSQLSSTIPNAMAASAVA
jgi:hypothetical protein